MPGSSNSSFIPKRNPQQQERRDPRRQVFVGTFVIRVLFFAVLVSSVLVFFVERQLKSANTAEISALDTAIASFNEAEMQRVINLHHKLEQVNDRLRYSASVVSILTAIENSITDSNYLTKIALERIDEGSFEVELTVRAQDFNSVLFQEKILKENQVLSVQEIDDLVVEPPSAEGQEEVVTIDLDPGTITFNLLILVDPSRIPHTLPTAAIDTSVPATQPVSVPATATTSDSNNSAL